MVSMIVGANSYKICSLCKKEKLLNEYWVSNRYSQGRFCYCKECCRTKRGHIKFGTPEHSKKISDAQKRYYREHPLSKEDKIKRATYLPKIDYEDKVWREKVSNGLVGKLKSQEHKKKLSLWAKQRVGEKNPNWKGGIASRRKRNYTQEDRVLRIKVLERDGNKCRVCSSIARLENHHIKSVNQSPELRFDVDNCTTLCHNCHKKTESWGKIKNSYREAV